MCRMFLRLFISLILLFSAFNAYALENCKWNNNEGIPCTTVSKTPNSYSVSSFWLKNKSKNINSVMRDMTVYSDTNQFFYNVKEL